MVGGDPSEILSKCVNVSSNPSCFRSYDFLSDSCLDCSLFDLTFKLEYFVGSLTVEKREILVPWLVSEESNDNLKTKKKKKKTIAINVINPFMLNGLFYLNTLDRSIFSRMGVWLISIITKF